MPKKILITGGAGFIGFHLARRLLRNKNNQLALVDNLARGRMDNDLKSILKNPRLRFLRLDLTRPSSFAKLGAGYEQIYHLAAINGTKLFYEMPAEVLRVNTLSLVYILEWLRAKNPRGKILFTSSNEAYAGGLNAFGKLPIPTPENVPLVIEDPYNPRWSYAATKLMGELLVIHYAAKYKLRALIVRPHNFYGPRAGYDHVIPEFCLRIAQKSEPFAINGADDTRTFCYIDDAVRAMQLLMDTAKTDNQPIETVHIGDRQEIVIKQLAKKMFKVAGWKPKKLEIKNSPPGSVKRRRADIGKLQKLTGWKPKVSLVEGLQKTYEWYCQRPQKR